MMELGQATVVCSFIAMVASNVLSTKKVFGGKDNKVISDAHPTYVTPDGLTFAVWGMIYLMLTVTTVAQALVSPESTAEELLTAKCAFTGLDTRSRLALAFLLNAVWLPVFSNEKFWAALLIMIGYLLVLLSTWRDVVNSTTVLDYVLVGMGVSMNSSWIVVATAVNTFLTLGEGGWKDKHGVSGSPVAGCIIAWLVAVLALLVLILAADPAWAFVAAWALRGIYRMQTIENVDRFPTVALNKNVALAAQITSFTVLFAAVFQLAVSVACGLK
eukprot:CAMPEP_0178425684 /NCGR_PEP_ID=MMETSP0689_2-20121128/28848_1 /TAXON_ID=160604 /ORGANISM="Amphidinium massartii, Strain CS-259" /LENGTH=272 /DNA_ID=CAMNT_0020047351 /DNA_START=1 /DNA_END=819 /DNA_ORIENTATION=+